MGLEFDFTEWKEFTQNRLKIVILVVSFLLVALSLHFAAVFICGIESRKGFAFDDPLLSIFKPIDLTWLIFFVLYFSVFFVLIHLIFKPEKLLLGFFSYTLLLGLRILSMYLLPLDPPKNIIPLTDPIIENFGTDITLTRDLFFSGHTSLMVLLFLLSEGKLAKIILFIGILIVGLGVMLQNVHYSVDVLVAVFASYCSYNWMKSLLLHFKLIKKEN